MSDLIIDQIWKEFGQRIRKRREQLNLTQEQVGSRAGMKRQQWNRLEQGASTKRSTILRIASALDLDSKEVLGWAGFQGKKTSELSVSSDQPAPAGMEELLLYYFRALPGDLRPDLLAVVAAYYRHVIEEPQRPRFSPEDYPSEGARLEILGQVGKG